MKLKSVLKLWRGQSSTVSVPVKNEKCTEFEVDNWVLSEFTVQDLIKIVGFSPYPLNEMLLMTGAVCRLRPEYIFEWGTHLGKSARIFSETCIKFGIRAQIHSTDLPDDVFHKEHPGNLRGKLVRNSANVFLHLGDGLSTSLEIASSLTKETPILFFLDGEHGFDSVHRELTKIMTHIPTASILVHDTFYQSSQSNYNIGPYLAIQAALKETPNSFSILSTNTGLPGMTLLYRVVS